MELIKYYYDLIFKIEWKIKFKNLSVYLTREKHQVHILQWRYCWKKKMLTEAK